MARPWTFGSKIGAGFAVTVALAVAIGAVATYALRTVVASKDRVISVNARNLIDAQKLVAAEMGKSAAARGFLLTGEDRFLTEMQMFRAEIGAAINRLKTQTQVNTDVGKRLIDEIERAEADHQGAADRVIAERKTDLSLERVAHLFEEQVTPKRDALDHHAGSFLALEGQLLEEATRASTEAASFAITLVIGIVLAVLVSGTAIAFLLTRTLTRQIGAAVQHVLSSSAELQAAANQQAAGAKEQATGMTEISTTISELLATSRQIAESAQRVAHIAEETAAAACAGDQTMQTSQESVGGIKRQVDLIVNHMLDLGRKSQQIGGVLEIINELAEQTNILAINASIEAAGANEAGRRFAVVADEIRKLADRVSGSTKEIRGLIEEIRTAVNTTVMATEGGTKAVDTGMRQFAAVVSSLKHIADLVGTTTEAAREIELSTKQQATAVEQVNVAVAGVAQATKESETSSRQTLQTASQLTTLSAELTALIRANGSI